MFTSWLMEVGSCCLHPSFGVHRNNCCLILSYSVTRFMFDFRVLFKFCQYFFYILIIIFCYMSMFSFCTAMIFLVNGWETKSVLRCHEWQETCRKLCIICYVISLIGSFNFGSKLIFNHFCSV